jgi:hypothetical protein
MSEDDNSSFVCVESQRQNPYSALFSAVGATLLGTDSLIVLFVILFVIAIIRRRIVGDCDGSILRDSAEQRQHGYISEQHSYGICDEITPPAGTGWSVGGRFGGNDVPDNLV